ncbi:MAG: co-chaperone GroES [Planctomycetota bacterium]
MATKTKKAKKTTIKPLEDRVLVLPDSAEEVTASGIYLPEAAKEKPQTGKVVAVGPGKLTDTGERGALSVKAGDTVMFGKYGGSEIDIDGVEHKILRESELLAVLTK